MPHSSFASAAKHWHLLAGLLVLLLTFFTPNSAAWAKDKYCIGDGCVDTDPLGLIAATSEKHGATSGGSGTTDPDEVWPIGEILFWNDMGDDSAPIELPGCNCYFSGDCSGGATCNYEVLSEEDNCAYMENKPFGTPGAGCDVVWIGDFQLGICDGYCSNSRAGSSFGTEDTALLQQGVRL